MNNRPWLFFFLFGKGVVFVYRKDRLLALLLSVSLSISNLSPVFASDIVDPNSSVIVDSVGDENGFDSYGAVDSVLDANVGENEGEIVEADVDSDAVSEDVAEPAKDVASANAVVDDAENVVSADKVKSVDYRDFIVAGMDDRVIAVYEMLAEMPSLGEMQSVLAELEGDAYVEQYMAYRSQVMNAWDAYQSLDSETRDSLQGCDELVSLHDVFFVNSTDDVNDEVVDDSVIHVNLVNECDFDNGSRSLVYGSGETIRSVVNPGLNSLRYWTVILVSKVKAGYGTVTAVHRGHDGYKGDDKRNIVIPDNGFALVVFYDHELDVHEGDIVGSVFDYENETSGDVEFISLSDVNVHERDNGLSVLPTYDLAKYIDIDLYDYGYVEGHDINAEWREDSTAIGFNNPGGVDVAGSTVYNGKFFDFGDVITDDLKVGISDVVSSSPKDSINNPHGANLPLYIANGKVHLVGTELGEDGYPQMADGRSLGYLFGDNTHPAVSKVNQDGLDGLFRYDESTKTYVFDSMENHAQYNPDTNRFDLYDARITPNFAMYPFGNFLPFNDIQKAKQVSGITSEYFDDMISNASAKSLLLRDTDDVLSAKYADLALILNNFESVFSSRYGGTDWTGADVTNGYFDVAAKGNSDLSGVRIDNSELSDLYNIDYDDTADFYFGMRLGMHLKTPKAGLLDGRPVKFNFQGDDDVLVFIDDKLVLDLTGIHRHVGGCIDFSTGMVSYYGFNAATGGIDFRRDIPVGLVEFSEIFDSEDLDEDGILKEGSVHHMQMFYMERGSGSGVCRMDFNFPLVQPVDYNVRHDYYTEYVDEDGNVTTRLDGSEDGGTYSGAIDDVVSANSVSKNEVFDSYTYEHANPEDYIVLTEDGDNTLVLNYVRSETSEYRVVHKYYTNYMDENGEKQTRLDGTFNGTSVVVNIGDTVSVNDVDRLPEYSGGTYEYVSADPESELTVSESVSDNVITLTYERDSSTSYKIVHEYYLNEIKNGEVVSTYVGETDGDWIPGNIGDVISTNGVARNHVYEGDTYGYVSVVPESELKLVQNVDENVIRLRYERNVCTGYRVIHKYYTNMYRNGTEIRVLDGKVSEPSVSGNVGDIVDVGSVARKYEYEDNFYAFSGVLPEDTLSLSAVSDANVIVLEYDRNFLTSYTVEHEYYTEFNVGGDVKRSFDGSYSAESVPGGIGDTVDSDSVERRTMHNGKEYTLEYVSPSDMSLDEDAGKNVFHLRYVRSERSGYRVVHEYYTGTKRDGEWVYEKDGSVEDGVVSANTGDLIRTGGVNRKFVYNDNEYRYVSVVPEEELVVSPVVSDNVIVLRYERQVEDSEPEPETGTAYRVIHNYYKTVNDKRVFVGKTELPSVSGNVGDVVPIDKIPRVYDYDGVLYDYANCSPESELVLGENITDNVINLYYVIDESELDDPEVPVSENRTRYKVVHKYYTVVKDGKGSRYSYDGAVTDEWVDGDVDEVVSVNGVTRKPAYLDIEYAYVSADPDDRLVLVEDENRNVITLRYERVREPESPVSSNVPSDTPSPVPTGTPTRVPTPSPTVTPAPASSTGSNSGTGSTSTQGSTRSPGSTVGGTVTSPSSAVPCSSYGKSDKTVAPVRTGDGDAGLLKTCLQGAVMSLSTLCAALFYRKKKK